MIQIPTCTYTQPEIFQSDVLKDDNKWYASSKNGRQRPLQFNISNGSWVTLLKAEGEGTRGRHHHSASVSAWTIEGAWGYREYDWVARAGSFVFEPPGHIHTLYVHPSEGRMLVLFHVYGPLVYLDENNNAVGYTDVFTELEIYKQHCLEQGLGEEWVRSLIR